MKKKDILGQEGENVSEKYLKAKGFRILERNWRYRKSEIDIIAQTETKIVFIEVKTRSTEIFGSPESFISVKQQKMIIEGAHAYIEANNIDLEARFDVISVIVSNPVKVNHIEDAFYAF